MQNNVIFTVSTMNYLHYSLNVRESFLKYNKNWKFVIFVLDFVDSDEKAFKIKELREQGLDIRSFMEIRDVVEDFPVERMLLKYKASEMCMSLKPFGLEYFCRLGFDKIIYVDSDIQFYNSIKNLEDVLDKYDVVITPHMMHMYPEDGKEQNFAVIMNAGLYNAGMVAIRNSENAGIATEFWRHELKEYCLDQLEKLYCCDQRWLDWFPSLVPNLCILRDYGYNVSYWNLHERIISKKDNIWYVNNDKLVFWHYSGVDLNNIDCISVWQNRYCLKDRASCVRELFQDYADRIKAIQDEYKSFVYFGNYVTHTNYKIPNEMRRVVYENQKFYVHNKNEALKTIKMYQIAPKEEVIFVSGYGVNIIGAVFDNTEVGEQCRTFIDKLIISFIPFSIKVLTTGNEQIAERQKQKYNVYLTDKTSYLANIYIGDFEQIEKLEIETVNNYNCCFLVGSSEKSLHSFDKITENFIKLSKAEFYNKLVDILHETNCKCKMMEDVIIPLSCNDAVFDDVNTVARYKILGLVPLLKVLKEKNKTIYYLLEYFPIFMKKNSGVYFKTYLFGIIPLLKIKKTDKKLQIYLFDFISLLKIKHV